MFLAVLVIVGVFGPVIADLSGIRNLYGEPSYRHVRLHWESPETQVGYQVRYCEIQAWGAQRCRIQGVPDSSLSKEIIRDGKNALPKENDYRAFDVEVKGLRMATTYAFEVREKGPREERAKDERAENVIVLPTKGFSAKATQCLPHASEIEVSTGPYFAGRIAVESTDGEKCALDGEPDSPRDTYTLRINHQECGSSVNDTTVATFVIVQENLPILTHSTRRFLVVCTYQPETLTVRAGINLPTSSGKGQAEMTSYDENFLGRQGRNFRTGRLLQKPQALVKGEVPSDESREYQAAAYHGRIVPGIVIAMLTLAGIIGLIAVALRIGNKRFLRDDLDAISVRSVSSCSTVSDLNVEYGGK